MADLYRYRLSSTGESSRRFGPCDVCGEHVSEVFLQTEEKRFYIDEGDLAMIDDPETRAEWQETGWGWTQHECFDYFGHKECLMEMRRIG